MAKPKPRKPRLIHFGTGWWESRAMYLPNTKRIAVAGTPFSLREARRLHSWLGRYLQWRDRPRPPTKKKGRR